MIPCQIDALLSKAVGPNIPWPIPLLFIMPAVIFHLHLLQGRNLAKGDYSTSDPFVRIFESDDGTTIPTGSKLDRDYLFQSRCKSDTLNPKFNEKFTYIPKDDAKLDQVLRGGTIHLLLGVFDDDEMHGEDPLGIVKLALQLDMAGTAEWYPVEKGEGDFFCEKASGELSIKVSVEQQEWVNEMQ